VPVIPGRNKAVKYENRQRPVAKQAHLKKKKLKRKKKKRKPTPATSDFVLFRVLFRARRAHLRHAPLNVQQFPICDIATRRTTCIYQLKSLIGAQKLIVFVAICN